MTDNVFALVAGLGIGAAAMYVLDPEMGRRRRAVARDKMTETGTKLRHAAGVTARDLGNRSTGVFAAARSRLSEREVSDEVLDGRVRAKLGFLVRRPSAIIARVSGGRVVLSGLVLPDEVQQVIRGIRAVRGVSDVENRLEVLDESAHASGLQADKPKPAGEVWDIMQRHWSPATRFLVGTAGAISLGLIAYALGEESWRSQALRPKIGERKESTDQENIRAGWAS